MNCPKCSSTMTPYTDGSQVELDYCTKCKGIWFDKGEISIYCTAPEDFLDLRNSIQKGKQSDFSCSHCPGEYLMEVPYAPNEALHIDWCPQCHGAFLDPRELGHLKTILAKNLEQTERLKLAADRLKANGYAILG